MATDYFKSPLNQTKMGAAILVACIARTLSESDPTFEKRLQGHLEETYAEVRDLAETDCLEMLSWLLEMLKTGNLRYEEGS